jgi:hypothetical protein
LAEKRKHCDVELRLNKRLAREIAQLRMELSAFALEANAEKVGSDG